MRSAFSIMSPEDTAIHARLARMANNTCSRSGAAAAVAGWRRGGGLRVQARAPAQTLTLDPKRVNRWGSPGAAAGCCAPRGLARAIVQSKVLLRLTGRQMSFRGEADDFQADSCAAFSRLHHFGSRPHRWRQHGAGFACRQFFRPRLQHAWQGVRSSSSCFSSTGTGTDSP